MCTKDQSRELVRTYFERMVITMFENNNIKINFHFDVNVEVPPAALPDLLKLSDKQMEQLKELAKLLQGAAKKVKEDKAPENIRPSIEEKRSLLDNEF